LPQRAPRPDDQGSHMNWWMLAAGLSALICAAGHAIAGVSMFYRPIRAAIGDELHAGVLTGMWHLNTVNFTLSANAFLCSETDFT
jgi:hypothetical protein